MARPEHGLLWTVGVGASITSMGVFGLLGCMLAREFRLPLVVAWRTNVHEYAAWRFERVAAFLPSGTRRAIAGMIERFALKASISFYRKGGVGLAPTGELVDLLRTGTHKPAFLMERGVDTELFDPSKRTPSDTEVVFGNVGRLSSEKNLRLPKLVEDDLLSAGIRDYRFEVIRHGAERPWLQNHLLRSRLPGVVLGQDLARSYADMDVFLFPSRTDTYGNVIWEASASGVPAVVTNSGGPRRIVQDRVTGLVSRSDEEFVRSALRLYRDPAWRTCLGAMARRAALRQFWYAVLDQLCDGAYRTAVAA